MLAGFHSPVEVEMRRAMLRQPGWLRRRILCWFWIWAESTVVRGYVNRLGIGTGRSRLWDRA